MIINPNGPTGGRPLKQTWENGIMETHSGASTSYRLPTDSVGVAREITVQPRLFGLLGSKVSAQDAAGNELKTRHEWHGFHRVLVAEDPSTGLTTKLDPRERIAAAGTPMEKTVFTQLGGLEIFGSKQQNWQELDAQGDLNCVSDSTGMHKTSTVKGVSITLMEDRNFVETRVSADGSVFSASVKVTERGCEHGASLPSAVEQNRVNVTRADGSHLEIPLYFTRNK